MHFPSISPNALTGQVKEVGVLAELIEDPRRAVCNLGGSQHSNRMLRQFVCESRAALRIFKGRDTGSDCQVSAQCRITEGIGTHVLLDLEGEDASHAPVVRISAPQRI